MEQNKQIAQHLSKKPITCLEAFNRYGILRLSARIYDLRKSGMEIKTTMVELKNGKNIAKYHL